MEVNPFCLALSAPIFEARGRAWSCNRSALMTSHLIMEDAILRVKLAALKSEHRDLDDAIEMLLEAPGKDQLQLARLKKRKLRLRDEIAEIEDRLLPDIIA